MKENIYQKRIREWTEKYGGLSDKIQLKIDKLVAEYDKKQKIDKCNKVIQITAGTKLVREYAGRLYSVIVVENGYEFNNKVYKSLSAIANVITGKHWNGKKFFFGGGHNMTNKKIKCAIYTRKSCEEGLEQDFNSLDAQREACKAYIKSQMHEGWTLIPQHYDVGGFSGGTIDRPAFKELLEDIENDKIDIVLVYKVDRLTRSIMDFAKIIEIFDKHQASFVSITQHFNTTTSMGRFTLNILLSFAQFEREVTGERIRDKFEATRKKGLWIFGKPPYGYTKDEHNVLLPELPACENIKTIFNLYLELQSVDSLRIKLKELNIQSRTGKEFSRGNIYNILSNKIYISKLQHKDKIYDGQHKGLIDIETFEKVQELLQQNAVVKNILCTQKTAHY